MDQPPKQSFNFTFYWQVSQTVTFFHVKQPYRNLSPPQHTAPLLSFSLLTFWRSPPLLLRQILHSLYHILKCRPMVKDGHEFVCFFYSCILLPEIVIQNSQLLTSWEQGIKHSIQALSCPHTAIHGCHTAMDDPGSPFSWRWMPLPRSLAMPTISGHFIKYQLAMQFMLIASTNSERSKISQSKRKNQHAQRMTTVHRQIKANAPLGKLVLPRWLSQHFPHKSTIFCGWGCPPPRGAAEQCPGMAKAGGSRARQYDLSPSLLQGRDSSLIATEQSWMQPAHLATSWSSHKFKLN